MNLDNTFPDLLYKYLEINSEDEPEILKELRQKTEDTFPNSHMISGHFQGRFLSLISKIIRPEKILEIGTYTGYATLCLAEGLPKNGKITTLERNEEMKVFFQAYFDKSEFSSQINVEIIDGIEFLENSTEKWDLVFLDANKKQYGNYLNLIIPLLNPNGILLVDNTLWKGKVLQEIDSKDKMTQAIFEFNQKVKSDERIEVVILPIRDGISLIRKI